MCHKRAPEVIIMTHILGFDGHYSTIMSKQYVEHRSFLKKSYGFCMKLTAMLKSLERYLEKILNLYLNCSDEWMSE
jgi:hypothetical protein